ncbi:hypothetical protein QA609_03245 [Natronococcus sp. A-GB7]|nr:hypothetical protein [Natronococcus sp. A-GB7]MDG5817816.1 hypothetical protein [Natronococcus sp. A-GB7]
MPDGESERGAITCIACSTVYAGEIWPGGSIRPIGRQSCECGSTEFEIIEESVGTPPKEKKTD